MEKETHLTMDFQQKWKELEMEASTKAGKEVGGHERSKRIKVDVCDRLSGRRDQIKMGNGAREKEMAIGKKAKIRSRGAVKGQNRTITHISYLNKWGCWRREQWL